MTPLGTKVIVYKNQGNANNVILDDGTIYMLHGLNH